MSTSCNRRCANASCSSGQYNTAAREAFGSVRRFLGGQCGAETNEIQHAIDTFDFEKAESGLLHLAQLLDLELREPNGLS